MGEDISSKDKTLLARFKHMKNVSITVAVVAMVIAVAGMIAGIYGVVQIQELNNKMDAAKENALSTKPAAALECENEDDEEDCVVSTDAAENDLLVADNDYIYIGEWGVKIKVPEGTFEMLSYKYDSGRNAVVFNAVTEVTDEVPGFYEENQGLVVVSRISKSEAKDITKVFEDGDYVYRLSTASGSYSTDSDEQEIETESMNKLNDILGNEENYSKF